MNLGVLVSGSGSNLQAILDAVDGQALRNARVAVVLSNRADAFALTRAQRAGVPSAVLQHGDYSSRREYDAQMLACLRRHDVDTVALAGFMRIVGKEFLAAFPGRVLNIHPSLLPACPGLHAPRQALEYGVKVTGATVHLVDAGVDSGPIVCQESVPVYPDDDETSLKERIQAVEHRLYPAALQLLAKGELRTDGRRVGSGVPFPEGAGGAPA